MDTTMGMPFGREWRRGKCGPESPGAKNSAGPDAADARGAPVKELYDALRQHAAELARWNKVLVARVQSQVEQLERLGRLRRLLPPQLVQLIESSGGDALLKCHQREIAALFCDLRGFTAFSERARAEEVSEILHVYHEAMGRLVHEFGGTIEHRAGDGMMVIFNDPLPCDDPAMQAVRLAVAMRNRMRRLIPRWRRRGYRLGFGVGVSLGTATLGMVGCEGRFDYAANGPTVNLAARLCDGAADGQILVCRKVHAALRDRATTSFTGARSLKGFQDPVETYNVTGLITPGITSQV